MKKDLYSSRWENYPSIGTLLGTLPTPGEPGCDIYVDTEFFVRFERLAIAALLVIEHADMIRAVPDPEHIRQLRNDLHRLADSLSEAAHFFIQHAKLVESLPHQVGIAASSANQVGFDEDGKRCGEHSKMVR